ncbi:MAG: class I mannose-6-phosphate isomerase, partial [Gorillibacterium sp.]|nr:class I mannose-6-phosphate isomerase [Gorillibacterium sp.]
MNKTSKLDRSQGPITLQPTRVWRTYIGGQLLEQWHGTDDPADGHYPEEWVSSVVDARNQGREAIINEGLSLIESGEDEAITLREQIATNPEAYLGAKHVQAMGVNPGVLVKMLDSAERLAIQVHPDRETAQRLFQSAYGKTEAWFFLGGREVKGEQPYVLCGFKPGMTRQKWESQFHAQDVEGMLNGLHKIYPQPGDVFLIRGGMPHAIGPGNWMIEIQEPTDYTIRIERQTVSGLNLSEHS